MEGSQDCHAAAERAEVMLEGPEIESSHCSSATARSVHPAAEEALAPKLRAERLRGPRGRDGQALPRSQEKRGLAPWLRWALTFVPRNCLDWETLPAWFPLHSIVQIEK